MTDLAQLLKLSPKTYQNTICKYLIRDSGPSDLAKLERGSMIACTARSGSTLLNVSLEHYGIEAHEHLNPEGAIKRTVERGSARTLREYANLLAAKAKGGRFDVKGPISSFLFLYEMREIPERLDRWKFVFLRRKNIVRQAISQRIAARTGQWTSLMEARGTVVEDDYSFEEILRATARISQQNERWERVFALFGIEPFRVCYEDFCNSIESTTWQIATFLDLDNMPASPRPISPRIERQTSELNEIWERRFRKELDSVLKMH
jgi:LPS sulfotransferase NodH